MKGGKGQQGFTIIEVVLFLAIASVLTIGIAATVSNTVNQQRYREGIRSVVAYIQSQYEEAINVRNDRSLSKVAQSCDGEARVATVRKKTDHQPRGTSDCVILGRFLSVEGSSITSRPVVAREKAKIARSTKLTDQNVLQRYVIRAVDTQQLQYDNTWDIVMQTKDGNKASYGILIVRSPESGLVRTYVSDEVVQPADNDLSKLVTTENTKQLAVCVAPNRGSVSPLSGVAIAAAASSQSEVASISEDGIC